MRAEGEARLDAASASASRSTLDSVPQSLAVSGPASGDLGRFDLLASAIAYRSMSVCAAEPGAATWTDGSTVFVGADVDDLLLAVTVQAALVGAGSLDPDVIAQLGRRTGVARRYLAVEGNRALWSQRALLPIRLRSVADATIASLSSTSAGSLEVARGRVALPEPPSSFGDIRPRAIRVEAASRSADVSAQSPIRTEASPLADLNDADEGEDTNDTGGTVVDFLSSPVGGGGPFGRLLKRLMGDARSDGAGPAGADAPTHRTRHGRPVGSVVEVTPLAVRMAEDATIERPRAAVYPEWDEHHRRYRPDWCTVTETPPDPRDATALALPDLHGLRRALASLGLELERRHRQPQGDDVDIDATVQLRVDAVAGAAVDEAVYVDTVRGRLDLAVLVLLDISGSAGEPGATGVPVHQHQRMAAAALTATLYDLGDRVALYAFRSMGRSAVTVFPVKRFEERFGLPVLTRLGGLTPGAYTRLGAAIRHGAAVLQRDSGVGRKLLVTLSDGSAYDHGYEGRYGEADARRALAESRRQGVGCLCLSIGATTESDALRRVFGTAAHALLPRVEDLASTARPLFHSALRSAEAQQRAWLRHKRPSLLAPERRTA